MNKFGFKIIAYMLCFAFGFWAIQAFMVPKYVGRSTTAVEGFYKLDDELDVLFLGASQMFCGIDAQQLTADGISAYDLGANVQPFVMTKYYLRFATELKTPKLVVVEVSSIFNDDKDFTDAQISWTYSPTRNDKYKWESLLETLGGDKLKAFILMFFPLIEYHSRWSELNPDDFLYYLADFDYSTRGFLSREAIEPQTIKYYMEDSDDYSIPENTKENIAEMKKICDENNIKLIFAKIPAASWSKKQSDLVQSYMDSEGYVFFDYNRELNEIGIDSQMDFYNMNHLNDSGAKKVTRYLEPLLESYLDG